LLFRRVYSDVPHMLSCGLKPALHWQTLLVVLQVRTLSEQTNSGKQGALSLPRATKGIRTHASFAKTRIRTQHGKTFFCFSFIALFLSCALFYILVVISRVLFAFHWRPFAFCVTLPLLSILLPNDTDVLWVIIYLLNYWIAHLINNLWLLFLSSRTSRLLTGASVTPKPMKQTSPFFPWLTLFLPPFSPFPLFSSVTFHFCTLSSCLHSLPSTPFPYMSGCGWLLGGLNRVWCNLASKMWQILLTIFLKINRSNFRMFTPLLKF